MAAALLAALVLGDVALRTVGFSFEIAPCAVGFGWPDPAVLEKHYPGDPSLFWVGKDYPA